MGGKLAEGMAPCAFHADNATGAVPVESIDDDANTARVPFAPRRSSSFVITSAGGGATDEASFAVLDDTEMSQVAPFRLLTPWVEAADRVAAACMAGEEVTACVCGAKGVGKSSFCKLLVNRLLNVSGVVAVLDADCGQPEFTLPGLVAVTFHKQLVTGPSFSHQRRPERAYFVGSASPDSDPQRYISSISAAYRWLTSPVTTPTSTAWQAARPPIVVNCHGWVKGLGLDLLTDVLRAVEPSHCIQLQLGSPSRNLPPGSFWLPDPGATPRGSVMPIPAYAILAAGAAGEGEAAPAEGASAAADESQAPGGSESIGNAPAGPPPGRRPRDATEARALLWLSWSKAVTGMAADARSVGHDALVAAADALSECAPFAADLSQLTVLFPNGRPVPHGDAPRLLNGAVVGLLAPPPPPGAQAAPYHEEPPLCVGLGLVRLVDTHSNTVFLLADVPDADLQQVSVLALSQLEFPSSLLRGSRFISPYLGLNCLGSDTFGAATAGKGRRNLLRNQLLATA